MRRIAFINRFLVIPLVSLFIFGAGLTAALHSNSPLLYSKATPSHVLAELAATFSDNTRLDAIYCTLYLCTKGFAFGLGLALVVGVVVGLRPSLAHPFQTVLNTTRSVPLTLLVPFLVLVPIMPPSVLPWSVNFDPPNKDPAWLIGLGVFVYLVIGMIDGIHHRNTERELILIRIVKMSRWRYLRVCLFWEALPRALTAMRLALLFSLVLAIVLEQLVLYPGAGSLLANWFGQIAHNGSHPEAKAIALMIVIAAVGITIDLVFSSFEHLLDRWRSPVRTG